MTFYYLIAGGLSKKPCQVGDGRVNHTIHHVTTTAWQTTHWNRQRGSIRMQKTKRRRVPFVCLFLALFNAIFYSTVVYLTVAYYLYLTVCFSQKPLASLSYYCKRSCCVRGGEVWAGTDMILIALVCDAVAADSDCLFTFTLKTCIRLCWLVSQGASGAENCWRQKLGFKDLTGSLFFFSFVQWFVV